MEEKIREYVEEIILDQPDLFVVKILLSGQRGNQILRVAMDGDDGITIERCASISRQLGARIEEADLIDDKFRLEVSSAGLEMPLQLERQYAKNLGRKMKVTRYGGEEVEGKLIGQDKEGLELEIDNRKQKIAFKEIEKSVIMISFK
ncbi:MAG: hypothetical protein GY816_06225 [Cytophagales bacterium]|nr:hypothetical protein [Cytophagales bacterium]